MGGGLSSCCSLEKSSDSSPESIISDSISSSSSTTSSSSCSSYIPSVSLSAVNSLAHPPSSSAPPLSAVDQSEKVQVRSVPSVSLVSSSSSASRSTSPTLSPSSEEIVSPCGTHCPSEEEGEGIDTISDSFDQPQSVVSIIERLRGPGISVLVLLQDGSSLSCILQSKMHRRYISLRCEEKIRVIHVNDIKAILHEPKQLSRVETSAPLEDDECCVALHLHETGNCIPIKFQCVDDKLGFIQIITRDELVPNSTIFALPPTPQKMPEV